MKTQTLTTNFQTKPRQSRGFTLLEMIGVLAVIAILAAVLLPKVFSAIDNARVSNASLSLNTVKTAIIDHYAKFGSLTAGINTTAPQTFAVPSWNYETNMIIEQLLDKPFATKIGDGTANTTIVLDSLPIAAATVAAPVFTIPYTHADGTASFSLDGNTGGTNELAGSTVVYAVITGVNLNDARALNALVDGNSPTLGESAVGTDLNGRVKYNFGANPTATVYIYLTHR